MRELVGKKIVLASGSPRRKELLEKAGIPFEVFVTDADESVDAPPHESVVIVSRRKAALAAIVCAPDIIIAADTIVYIQGKTLGKPKNEADAFDMLKLLEGKWHEVYTGMTVAFSEAPYIEYVDDVCRTGVKFRHLNDDEIMKYIATGEPLDKAGAYGIQGAGSEFVTEIDGDYDNVVGLPVNRLLKIIKNRFTNDERML